MDKEELIKLLKENLVIVVDHVPEGNYNLEEISVKLLFDGELISKDMVYVLNKDN